MKKRLLSFILSFILILACTNMVFAVGLPGSGTAQSPYLINKYIDLWSIPSSSTACYKLTDDLDGTGYIKLSLPNFEGTLDGDGYSIKNITIDNGDGLESGLFSTTDGADIKNLILENINIKGNKNSCTGGLVGVLTDSTVTNVHINGGTVTGGNHAGGLIGNMKGSTISNCSTYVTTVSNGFVSPLVSCAFYNSVISKCSSSGSADGYYAAGIVVGTMNYSIKSKVPGTIINGTKIDNCFSNAHIKGYTNASGLVGLSFTDGSSVTNCYFAGDFYFDGNTMESYPLAPDDIIVKSSYFDKERIKMTEPYDQSASTESMKKQSTYRDWDFEKIWTIKEGESLPTLRPYENKK